ncbi:MAG: hypothetical protein GY737_06595 [Desulfobacteraceae bacterium]|nr:hypothetical protein [Desulfobacteraceae bacterium]
MEKTTQRIILLESRDFKKFWKSKGPFRYALTSREFPPILLEPEEWIFSDDITALLKELMQWEKRKMKFVQAPFSRKKKNILKPEDLSPWRIVDFPEEWERSECSSFTPVGYVTEEVTSAVASEEKADVEAAFFKKLARDINGIGYVLLSPEPILSPGAAYVEEYLKEWMADEAGN